MVWSSTDTMLLSERQAEKEVKKSTWINVQPVHTPWSEGQSQKQKQKNISKENVQLYQINLSHLVRSAEVF